MVVFFMRTVQMLQGLCTLLEVQLPFLRPFALRAQQALLAHSRETAALASPPPPPRAPPTSALQERTLRLLHALADTAEVVGAQVCLFVEGRCVVDAAAGRMGLVDARPVRPPPPRLSTPFTYFRPLPPLPSLPPPLQPHAPRLQPTLATPLRCGPTASSSSST